MLALFFSFFRTFPVNVMNLAAILIALMHLIGAQVSRFRLVAWLAQIFGRLLHVCHSIEVGRGVSRCEFVALMRLK